MVLCLVDTSINPAGAGNRITVLPIRTAVVCALVSPAINRDKATRQEAVNMRDVIDNLTAGFD